MNLTNAKKVIKAIEKYKTFMITSHINLEGDALGSELALASLLRKLGKKAYIVNASPVPANYGFLPGAGRVPHGLTGRNYQAVFIIDCANKARIGAISHLLDKSTPIINIDHHIGNKNFGRINWVECGASSVGEMIYHLFKLAEVELDRHDALNIYAALLTDTGSFRHANTTPEVLGICSELLKFGIEPVKVYAKVYENNSVQDVKCLAEVISNISFVCDNKVAWIKISEPEFKEIGDKPELLDKVLDLCRCVKTVKIVVLFCQLDKGLIKVNLRSKSPINVQRIAHVFGGGGHRFASGCIIKKGPKEAERALLSQVKKALTTKD
ncbi:MAG: bifunctional oligoribonuclease/PAP phosphatase NrnA [Candidatus Omnitrophota bacterium]|nr:MAG: bifunctional oligoribonuclease/PAP phosphatase NrnA [Candidatus Omnitrophota bacterium]